MNDFTSRNDEMLALAKSRYPEIGICVGAGERAMEIVERAIAIGAQRVQLVKWAYTPEMIKKAHENGIRVNFFWEDDPKEAVALFEAGVDCVLTNDLLAVKNALDEK